MFDLPCHQQTTNHIHEPDLGGGEYFPASGNGPRWDQVELNIRNERHRIKISSSEYKMASTPLVITLRQQSTSICPRVSSIEYF